MDGGRPASVHGCLGTAKNPPYKKHPDRLVDDLGKVPRPFRVARREPQGDRHEGDGDNDGDDDVLHRREHSSATSGDRPTLWPRC